MFFFVRVTLFYLVSKVRNINVDFCVHIKKCLLTEDTWLVSFTSAWVFYSSVPKLGTFFMGHLVLVVDERLKVISVWSNNKWKLQSENLLFTSENIAIINHCKITHHSLCHCHMYRVNSCCSKTVLTINNNTWLLITNRLHLYVTWLSPVLIVLSSLHTVDFSRPVSQSSVRMLLSWDRTI